ncbi:MAG: hypothetical protein FWH14_03745 [Oscillospiraceae bacterium]|nr:hypothetical protein [Oscillospiraceae bacterium]
MYRRKRPNRLCWLAIVIGGSLLVVLLSPLRILLSIAAIVLILVGIMNMLDRYC